MSVDSERLPVRAILGRKFNKKNLQEEFKDEGNLQEQAKNSYHQLKHKINIMLKVNLAV